MTSSNAIESFLKSKDFLGCYPLDRLPPFPKKLPKSMIINTHTSNKTGEHWLALVLTKQKCLYFDSFGWSIIEGNILRYLKPYYKTITYSDMCIQDSLSDRCREFCIAFIQNFKNVPSYNRFLSKFDSNYLKNNDKIVLSLLK